ncbi:hypothetical protein SAMN04490243_0575 [Robiginitalea myxolifaciens]|uniref:Uncharacterized protein n=1 Tax=Robiginitalea myxolifaciens TaxID=400055 RepID=A0A1I6FSH9_9FLAO|nr:hypothetical protein SAMN04490243_0575 [Robiginitalea myxolifaciens]
MPGNRVFNTLGKIVGLSVILFTLSIIFFALLPSFEKENSHPINLESIGRVYVYLFLIFIWIYFIAVAIYHILLNRVAKNSNWSVKAILAVVIASIFGFLSFNFGHMIDGDYSRIAVTIPLLVFYLFIGFCMYFFYGLIFRKN